MTQAGAPLDALLRLSPKPLGSGSAPVRACVSLANLAVRLGRQRAPRAGAVASASRRCPHDQKNQTCTNTQAGQAYFDENEVRAFLRQQALDPQDVRITNVRELSAADLAALGWDSENKRDEYVGRFKKAFYRQMELGLVRQADPARPPALAEWLVTLFVKKGRAEAILGDLEELFGDDLERRGKQRARALYYARVMRSLAPLVWSAIKKLGIFVAVADVARRHLGW